MKGWHPVEPGQVYRDCDPRMEGRRVRIVSVDERYAQVQVIADRLDTVQDTVGRIYRVLLDRFHDNQDRRTGFARVVGVQP